jgi:hypothetical protein
VSKAVSKARILLATGLTELCSVWTRHLLKLAIAHVAARSDRDCRMLGLDRAELLAGLIELHSAAGRTRREAGSNIGHPTAERRQPLRDGGQS